MTNIEDDVLALDDDGIDEVIDDTLNYARAMRFIAESDLMRDDTAPGCAYAWCGGEWWMSDPGGTRLAIRSAV